MQIAKFLLYTAKVNFWNMDENSCDVFLTYCGAFQLNVSILAFSFPFVFSLFVIVRTDVEKLHFLLYE